jgi:chromosome segregation ATPase
MKYSGWILSGIMIAGTVFAQQGPVRGAASGRAFPLQGLKNYLNLSDDQVSGLKTVEAEMRDALRSLAQDLREKTRVLREENQKSAPDPDVIARLKEEITGLQDQIKTQRADFQGRLRGILNADQLASLTRLEEALRLFPIARAAAAVDLIDAPGGAGFGRFGRSSVAGPRGMIRGLQSN